MQITTSIIDDCKTLSQELLALNKGQVRSDGCTQSQWRLLDTVASTGIINTVELSKSLGLDLSVVSRMLKVLISKQLIETVQYSQDKRFKPVRLTEKGRKFLIKKSLTQEEYIEKTLKSLSDSEQAIASEGLRLFSKALQRTRLKQEFEIRPIEKEDAVRVASVVNQVMGEFGFKGARFAHFAEELGTPYEVARKRRAAYFVVCKENNIVGCGGISPLSSADDRTCELRKMFLLSEARGAGMGRVLLSQCLEHAKKLGFRRCYVETTGRMALGKLLFQKMGFKPCKKMGDPNWNVCDEFYLKDL